MLVLVAFCRSAALLLPLVLLPFAAAAQEDAEPRHDCVVRQFVTAQNVTNLEPVGETTRFETGAERAYAFARLDCAKVGGGEVFWFSWMRGDKEVGKSRARVDVSKNWRIWSQSRLFPGQWTVLLKDSAGRLQAERHFTVDEPTESDPD